MKPRTLLLVVILLSAVTSFAVVQLTPSNGISHHETSYERILRTGTLRCGYEYWDSAIMRDPKTNELYGEWVDFINEIGKAASLKIVWAEHVGWGDGAAALKSGKVDALCAGPWQSTEKAKEMAFSIPIVYQSIEAFARSDDHRFDNNVDRINNEDVTIVVIDADNSDFLAREDFPKAKRMALGQMAASENDLYLSLAAKKADVTFDTPGVWRQFDKANPGKVRRIAPGHHLRVFGLSVAVDNDDPRLLNLINVGVQEISNSGMVDKILKKYESTYPEMYLKTLKPFSYQ